MPSSAPRILAAVLALASARYCAAVESFEFVAEHLPEVAMDNRFAALPLWSARASTRGAWQFTVQGGFTQTRSGGLTLDGTMFSTAVLRQVSDRWSVSAFVFLDDLQFSGGGDQRLLETLFVETPLALPAPATFSDPHGTYRNMGAGVAFNLRRVRSRKADSEWTFGALYQPVELRDYRTTYLVLEGPDSGAGGFVDYSGDYTHFTPFAGIALPRRVGRSWTLSPHVLLAVPLPRRGIKGRITGPGFDLSGDTAEVGHGTHFGDMSVTFGLDATYEPWGLSVDLGSLLSQALLEPLIHIGIDQNWLISVRKRF